MSGFPIIAAPALLLVCIENGRDFGRLAAEHGFQGVFGWLCFVLWFRWIDGRGGKLFGIVAGLTAWLVAGLLMSTVPSEGYVKIPMLAVVIVVGLILGQVSGATTRRNSLQTWIRVALATALVIVTIIVAQTGDAVATGLSATFPVLASSLIVPVYWNKEFSRAGKLASGMVVSGPSLAMFFAVFSSMIAADVNYILVFGVSIFSSALIHVAMWETVKRLRMPD
jgi:hypothetical protein